MFAASPRDPSATIPSTASPKSLFPMARLLVNVFAAFANRTSWSKLPPWTPMGTLPASSVSTTSDWPFAPKDAPPAPIVSGNAALMTTGPVACESASILPLSSSTEFPAAPKAAVVFNVTRLPCVMVTAPVNVFSPSIRYASPLKPGFPKFTLPVPEITASTVEPPLKVSAPPLPSCTLPVPLRETMVCANPFRSSVVSASVTSGLPSASLMPTRTVPPSIKISWVPTLVVFAVLKRSTPRPRFVRPRPLVG